VVAHLVAPACVLSLASKCCWVVLAWTQNHNRANGKRIGAAGALFRKL
jgi:hypothetical protein